MITTQPFLQWILQQALDGTRALDVAMIGVIFVAFVASVGFRILRKSSPTDAKGVLPSADTSIALISGPVLLAAIGGHMVEHSTHTTPAGTNVSALLPDLVEPESCGIVISEIRQSGVADTSQLSEAGLEMIARRVSDQLGYTITTRSPLQGHLQARAETAARLIDAELSAIRAGARKGMACMRADSPTGQA